LNMQADEGKTSDEAVKATSERKAMILGELNSIMKQAAIDCKVHAKVHAKVHKKLESYSCMSS